MPAKNSMAAVLLPLAALAVPSPGMGLAGADGMAGDEKARQDFKDDVKEWLQDTDEYKASSGEKAAELHGGYDALLRATIEQARVESGTRELSEAEVQDAIKYIIYETMKDERLKIIRAESAAQKVDLLEPLGIQAAYAACPRTVDPNYLQLAVDITGGSMGGYASMDYSVFEFEGGNTLYKQRTSDNPITCERTYELHFHDEDHPTLDKAYDLVRLIMYGRTHDIEAFTIRNNSQIVFDDVWSGSKGYADCFARDCHHTATKAYAPGQAIYVSNTWNHMMDTVDTNMPHINVPIIPAS